MPARTCLPYPTRRLLLAATAATLFAVPALAQDTLKLGLVAAMSGQSAKSGEAIVRGLSIAIDEINAKGGVLGKKVELLVRDDESNPAKGAVAARELVQREKVAGLFGGLDTPVSIAIVPFANQSKVPFMGVWAAGTPITRNGAAENYVFRVSAVDVLVDKALVDYAIKKYATKKPGMILINNPWGKSNERGLKEALAEKNMPYAGIEKFQDADVDVVPQLTRLKDAGADVLFMVANVAPSSQVVKSLDRMGWNVPIVSHWGPAGGRFSELAGPSGQRVHFIQTFSFSGKLSPKAEGVLARAEEEISRDQGSRRRDARGRHRQRLRCDEPDDARDRQGRFDRRPEDPRGVLRARQVRGPDQDLQQAVHSGEPRCADVGRLHLHLLQGRRDPSADELELRFPLFRSRERAAFRASDPGREMLLISAIVSGLAVGSMYGLIALGFHTTYVVSNTVNFAQGSSVMLGAVLGYTFAVRLGLPMPLAVALSLLLCALFGLVVERALVRPFVERGSNGWLMATVAGGIVLDNIVLFTFGKEPRAFPSFLAQKPIELFGAGVFPLQLIIPVVGIGIAIALQLAFHRTHYGKALLAVVQNKDAARLMGINVRLAIAFSFALSTALAGLAGMLIAPLFSACIPTWAPCSASRPLRSPSSAASPRRRAWCSPACSMG